jgi:hypothetical protein
VAFEGTNTEMRFYCYAHKNVSYMSIYLMVFNFLSELCSYMLMTSQTSCKLMPISAVINRKLELSIVVISANFFFSSHVFFRIVQ